MKRQLAIVAEALAWTFIDQMNQVGSIFIRPAVGKYVKSSLKVGPAGPTKSVFFSSKFLTKKAVDGAVLAGQIPAEAWAKFTLPKGLPKEGQRTLVIPNNPHEINDFDGVIEKGYGKGTKNLLLSQRVPVKVEGNEAYLGKINYHVHDADVAGVHYDLVVEGVQPGTSQFEINIPNGQYKGRYAFVTTGERMICVPMKDRGIVLPKPQYKLRPEELLNKVTAANKAAVKGQEPYTVEWKPDGSLGNASIEEYRTVFRSHRDNAETYYDRLPALEYLRPIETPFRTWNVFALPKQHDLSGTILQGELFHPNGVSFVSGILNSLPERAQAVQEREGPVEYYIWDIQRYKGKDVSQLPYAQRRQLAADVVQRLYGFNDKYHLVPAMDPKSDALKYYQKIVNDRRGLPYSEGVVVKDNNAPMGTGWEKVKAHDFTDVVISGFVEGAGKYTGNLGTIVVTSPDGVKQGEVGTGFTDLERRWIWDNRSKLIGAMIKAKVMQETETSFRAPRFVEFHEGKGKNDFGLQMYAHELALGDSKESKRILYSLKSAAGWKPKG